MDGLTNFVYVPYWLLILLIGLAFIGFEHITWRAIRYIDRKTRPRPAAKPVEATSTEIITLDQYRREQSGS